MPRLSTIKPRVQTLPQRLTPAPEAPPAYGQGRGGRPWRRKRAAILKRDGGLCQPCKRKGELTLATQVDHIVPRAEGGTEDDSNLQSICTPCHDVKTQQEAARARRRG